MTRPARLTIRTLLFALAAALAAAPAAAQISEADRLQRCANNREALTRINSVFRAPVAVTEEHVARMRTALVSIRRQVAEYQLELDEMRFLAAAGEPYPRTTYLNELRQGIAATARAVNIVCTVMDDGCPMRIVPVLERAIDEAVARLERDRATEAEAQRYQTNLMALRCDQGTYAEGTVLDTAQWMTGTFDSDFGVMSFGPGGGSYDYQGGRLAVSSINGNVVQGRWQQTRSGHPCPDGGYWGNFRFQFSERGFSGSYDYCGTAAGGSWSGRKRG